MTRLLQPYPRYQDAGLEWLDTKPDHWTLRKVKQVAHLKSGESITSDDIEPVGEYPVFGGNGVRGFGSRYTHDGEYVLIGRQGALCGNINYAQGRFWASEHAVVASPVSPYEVLWFGELLRTMNLNQYSIAAAQPGLAVERIQNLSLPVPPLCEQMRIGRYISYMDRRIRRYIAARRKLIALLNEQKQAIIHRAVTRGLDPNVRLKPSGVDWLGDVPEHWDVVKLRNLATKFGSGVTPLGGRQTYQQSGVPFIRSQNVHFDGLRLEDVAYIARAVHDSMPNTHVSPGDVLLNITGASIGRACAVPPGFAEGNVNQHVCIIRARADRLVPEFLAAFLSSPGLQAHLYHQTVGASREGLTLQSIRSFDIPLPRVEEQRAIMAAVAGNTKTQNTLVAAAQQDVDLLLEYRTRLIADVVTGKVDVREVAARLPDEPDDVDAGRAEPREETVEAQDQAALAGEENSDE